MAFVHEVQVQSTGFPGAPGFTNLYFETTIGADRDLQFMSVYAFLLGMSGLFPSTWTGTVQASGRVLEETSGLLAEFSDAPGASIVPVPGVAGGGFGSGVSGLCIGWQTATINRSRLVRGRTFMVPLAAGAYEADGTITAASMTAANGVSQDLVDSGSDFSIWSRPRLGTGGKIAPVTARRVNDRAVFLSSRRS